MAKKRREPTVVIPFRLSPELVKRLDQKAERMRREQPGLNASRADALRVLLVKALESESEEGSHGEKTSTKD